MKKVSVKVFIIVIVVAVVGTCAGFVIAETFGNKIYAAYSKRTGVMRYLADPTNYDANKEVPIEWNVQGVPGLPGIGFSSLASATNNTRGYISSND